MLIRASAFARQLYGAHRRGYTVRLRPDLFEALYAEVWAQLRIIPELAVAEAVRVRNVVFLPRSERG